MSVMRQPTLGSSRNFSFAHRIITSEQGGAGKETERLKMLKQLGGKIVGLGITFVLSYLQKKKNHKYLVFRGGGAFKEKENQTALNKEGEGYL